MRRLGRCLRRRARTAEPSHGWGEGWEDWHREECVIVLMWECVIVLMRECVNVRMCYCVNVLMR